MIVFHGHTHYYFNADMTSPNINFSRINSHLYSIHAPSIGYPRNRNAVEICRQVPAVQPSQGYFVERHIDKIVIKGYEFNPNVNDGFDASVPLRTYIIGLV